MENEMENGKWRMKWRMENEMEKCENGRTEKWKNEMRNDK